ncbi:TrlF family AAA-like ATPase [uncultured Rothia sp.]|uniref:TrlF family AAA-like ATPase n=1 Tax=uncultured Rothia sp. TaxID=316088 RepID=UPI00288AD496|nr:hypothetical protein [uncultured Rothia sp.]
MSGVRKFPRGSEWRKWDLHVHTPGTKLNNKYKFSDLDQEERNRANELYEKCKNMLVDYQINEQRAKEWLFWIDTIHNSDVGVIGVTDYYSLENFFLACNFYNIYKKIERVHENESVAFFPNLEFRTNDRMNKDSKKYNYVNAHILFTPEITVDKWDMLKHNLRIRKSTGVEGAYTLADIKDSASADGATIPKDNIVESLKFVFGDNYRNSCVLVVSGRKDGISMGENGGGLKTDNIFNEYVDMFDGIFSMSAGDIRHWLKSDNTRGAKPCFGGSDAHNFGDLKKKLGKQGEDGHCNWKTTWIKADPTFEGFLQVFIEPGERVKIQETEPDFKRDYAWIKEVSFKNNEMFPENLPLNKNLNSVIGSRSSGKSALLGYIARATKADNFEQVAPGILDDEAKKMGCTITWGDNGKQSDSDTEINRNVLYIPQNRLFNISSRPEEVTKLINSSIKSFDENSFISAENEYKSYLSQKIDEYFAKERRIQELKEKKSAYPEPAVLTRDHQNAVEDLQRLMKEDSLSEEERDELTDLRVEKERLCLEISKYKNYQHVSIREDLLERVIEVPSADKCNSDEIEETREFIDDMIRRVKEFINMTTNKYASINNSKLVDLNKVLRNVESDLHSLEGKLVQSESVDKAREKCKKFEDDIKDYREIIEEISLCESNKNMILSEIAGLKDSVFEDVFGQGKKWNLGKAEISPIIGYSSSYYDGIDAYIDQRGLRKVNEYISQNESKAIDTEGRYIRKNSVDYKKLSEVLLGDIETFIKSYMNEEEGPTIPLKGRAENQGDTLLQSFLKHVFCSPRQVLLVAKYDGDTIGGYKDSTMTPGKQAVFALELLLSQVDSSWPLLIDQPEDDLDSRSIYDSIVPKIRELKKRRQIIMVSHDANMVVGSDSEEVIIVNRHGEDRKNKDERYFDYLSGSLENTMLFDDSIEETLLSQGVREHCCVILDGGEEAFAKRKSKYNI